MPAHAQGDVWAYRDNEWLRQALLPCDLEAEESGEAAYAYRDGGVYVIVGGAGGLGEVLSEHLVRTHCAHVVWIGRRARDEAIDRKIERLAQLGPAPMYVQADAAIRVDLERAYRDIKARHARIDGIVHSAIVLLDKSLANMDEARFLTSLSAKVDASVHMAEVFGGEPLDFVLFFSSLQSFARASGQANYAAGCTFKDAFALTLARAWLCPVRIINWGYWGSVGIVASSNTRQRMAQLGVASIEPDEGIAAIDRLLAGPFAQLAFMKSVDAGDAGHPVDTRLVAMKSEAPSIDIAIFARNRPVAQDG